MDTPLRSLSTRAAGRVRATVHPSSRWGIRTRLVLLVLVLVLPFLAHLFFAAQREADAEREHARDQVLAVAQLTASRLDDQVKSIYQLLATLSRTVSPRPADAVRNDALLKSLEPELPKQLADVSVWTAEGDNIGSLDPGLRSGLESVARRGFFRQALQSNGLAVEAPLVSPSSGEKVAVLAMPLRRDGRIVGVVSASMRLLQMQTLLDPKATLPPGAVITVRDANGMVLARSLDAEHWIGRTIMQPPRGTASRAGDGPRSGVLEGPSADGRERVAGLVTATAVPWNVYVGIPTDIALRSVHARLRQHLMFGGGVLLFGLLLAAAVAERVSRPLRQLGADAAELGAGNLAHRSRVDAGGETGLLAATLNRMAEALQERTAALSSSEQSLRQVTDNVPALVSYVDRDLRFRFANRAYSDWLGQDPAALIGHTLAELYGDATVERLRPHFDAAFRGERTVYERELTTPAGKRHVEVTLVPDLDLDLDAGLDGNLDLDLDLGADADTRAPVRGLHVLMHDITARREAEARLRQLAQHDSLTGLPNRWLFHDRLKRAQARAQRAGGTMALLFVDIDHFKPVNDRFGHAVGDLLLQEFARRLLASVRATDTVARLGGDEFTVILEGLTDAEQAQRMAARIVETMRRPVRLGGHEVKVSASIGIALREAGDAADGDGEALLQRADAALYRAKEAGRDGWRVGTAAAVAAAATQAA